MRFALILSWVLLFLGPAAGQNYTIRTFAGGGLPEGIGVSASLGSVAGVATDAAGSVYLAAVDYNVVLRLDTTGMLTRAAGNGTPGDSGDNGPATRAQLNSPMGLAVDAAGDLYIVDQNNHRVRKVSNGVITTVAGNGTAGYSGDHGPAAGAQLNYPRGAGVDTAGNLYIADTLNNRIRKVSNGVVSTVAGTGSYAYSGDNGPAISAELCNPWGVAADASGNLYIADTLNSRIRKVSDGLITTVAGSASAGYGGDDGPASDAKLFFPRSVAVDAAGNLYIADTLNNRIRKVSNGMIATVAGNGVNGPSGDGGFATSASLASPAGVAFDSAGGNLYIADYANQRLRKVSNSVIGTAAGQGTQGYLHDDGPALGAQLLFPKGVAVDSAGNLYIADYAHHRIRKVSNGVMATVAGSGSQGYGGDNGLATSAQLNYPRGVAVDAAGNLYIADTNNSRIRKVSNGVITTVAGNGTPGYNGENVPLAGAQLECPYGVAVDARGSLYIADSGRIRKVSNGVIATVAGTGLNGSSGDGGLAASAQLYNPQGVAVDAAGNLYIADTNNCGIRKVSNGVITTVAGNGLCGYSGAGGLATGASLAYPTGVAVDAMGNLYIADTGNFRIRRISNGVITTLAGTGAFGHSGDDGPATRAQLTKPAGIVVDVAGNVYVSDYDNHRVRMLTAGQPGCTYSVHTSDLGTAASGGAIELGIHTDAGCAWSVENLPDWVTVSGNSQGTGPATVSLTAGVNAGGPRTASVSVGGISVPVRQFDSLACGGSSSCWARALPHVAFGGEWTTGLSAINTGPTASSLSLSFYGDNGSGVSLPFTGGLGSLSALNDMVPALGMKYYEAESPGVPVQGGWALVTADESLTVQATFRRRTSNGRFYEAAVPGGEGYSRFVMPFDATTFAPIGAQLYTGFAIANLSPGASAHVICTARNQSGTLIPGAVSIPALNPLGHFAGFNFPGLIGQQGTLDCSADTLLAAVALRAIGGDAFSTLPVIVK